MDAPNPGYLWLFTWLCAASVAAGTLVLFAILGSRGQLIALLFSVYLGLASAGLTRGIIAATAGLMFWLVLGAAVVRWYDRNGRHRLGPDLIAYVQQSVSAYQAQAKPEPQTAENTQ